MFWAGWVGGLLAGLVACLLAGLGWLVHLFGPSLHAYLRCILHWVCVFTLYPFPGLLFCMRIYAVSFPWVVVLYAYLRCILSLIVISFMPRLCCISVEKAHKVPWIISMVLCTAFSSCRACAVCIVRRTKYHGYFRWYFRANTQRNRLGESKRLRPDEAMTNHSQWEPSTLSTGQQEWLACRLVCPRD